MNTNSLEKIQRRAARIVCKSKDSDCAMDFLKWGTLLNRRKHHTFNIVNKCISGNCPQFLIVILILIRVYLNVQPDKVNIFIYHELEQRL